MRKIKHKLIQRLLTVDFRLVVLVFGFIALILTRQLGKSFGISLGYLYITLISLAGFWFGMRGGIWCAAIASIILALEISLLVNWPNRDIVIAGLLLRFLVYFLSAIAIGYFSTEEKKLKVRLQKLSQYDELTGCINFRWTMKILELELIRSQRYQKEMSIALIDIDHFKKINDTYGHLVGNDALKTFSDILRDCVRTVDIVCRYGGEEFLIILPEANLEQATIALGRIKSELGRTKIHSTYLPKETSLSITFSAGASSFPLNGTDLNGLISVADSALYQAKRSGRNKSVIERRRCLRVTPFVGLKIEITSLPQKEDFQRFTVENISSQGMRILFPKTLHYGAQMLVFFPQFFPYKLISCKLSILQEQLSFEVTCKVIHQEDFKDTWHRIGLQFTEIPPHGKEKLLEYIYNHSTNTT